ncbi:MAG TPA: ABC transporter substrate-binding protein [Caulobacteraceae bacterium]|nr:ABC transporter substrate-binding protein [Caulobacteraceae bacterium]
MAAMCAAAVAASSAIAATAPADPAAARVEAFDSALLAAMKEGPAAGAKARARRLAASVEQSFDLPTMTQFAVGPAWSSMSEAQHRELIAAFTRYSVASYAHNFDSYSGQKFEVTGVQNRGADKIVQARLVAPHEGPVSLMYRMRQTPAGPKIIDVYFDNISQLTTRRADFAASLASGGAAGLLVHLETLTNKLLS